ncbi:TonB-dependent receptor, partial [Acinetobacter baumannii]|nr:TonB-dependent receptor [Acinetobacter baumannii]MCW1766626.1 TonB-dependent receptor [Acinetobacter baumannii]
IPEPSFKPFADDLTRTSLRGVYGQLRIKPTQALTLVAGARKSWWKTETSDRLQNTRSGYEVDGQFTPFAAVLFDLNDSWTLYASQSRIFQPQGGRLAGGGQLLRRAVGLAQGPGRRQHQGQHRHTQQGGQRALVARGRRAAQQRQGHH